MTDNDVVLMYSGGLDSTAAALLLCERFDTVHLLTYSYGYGQLFLNWSKKGYRSLVEALGPKRFVHVIGSCKQLFQQTLVRSIVSDWKRYRSRFIWCMACKLAMHASNIIYCLDHRISAAADGSSRETNYYVEQMEESLNAIAALYSEYGIEFLTPVYEMNSRDEKIKLLASNQIKSIGVSIADRNPGTQPLCLPGNLIYFASTFLKRHPRYDPATVLKFIEDKKGIVKEAIHAHLRKKAPGHRHLSPAHRQP